MSKRELYKIINGLQCDIEFDYKGIHGSVCPINRKEIYIAYGDESQTCKSVDEAMSAKFFAGSPLNDIADNLDIY